MKHHRAALLLAAFITAAYPASATSVVCIRSPASLVIAADSLLTVRGDDKTGTPPRECKIIQAGDLFFSMTGFVKDPARSYDAVRIIGNALRRPTPPHDPVALVADAMKAGLQAELVKVRAEAPGLYNRYIREGKGALVKILLASYDVDSPRVDLISFRQEISPFGEIRVSVGRESCPGDCDPGRTSLFVLGDRRPIDAHLKKMSVTFRSPEKAAKSLVELVIDAHTPDVGPPVDVLKIDREGAKWIGKKEECPEVR